MKVVFKGVKNETRKRGCGCHGRRGNRITSIKVFHLPSGGKMAFRIGKETVVNDSDGQWLLDNYPEAFREP